MDKSAQTHFPIEEKLARRWSPYVFSDRSVDAQALRSIFEAARWAPSSFNEQPWRFIVGIKGRGSTFQQILSCLAEGNQVWAENAPVLVIGIYQKNFSSNGKPNKAAPHDLGLASANMILEATRHDLFAHMMIGMDPEAARSTFEIPDGAEPYVAMAIGHHGEADHDHSALAEREGKPRTRLPQQDFVFSSGFGNATEF